MSVDTTTLPDGRNVYGVNDYEVGFSWHEIASDVVTEYGRGP